MAALLFALLLTGCRQDMHDQPKYTPLEKSTFFADGRASRPYVEGTVPAGEFIDDSPLYTGKIGDAPATAFPFAIAEADMRRGQERYDIFCAPCHSRVGDGNGMIVQRGLRQPPTFHSDRLRTVPVGHLFEVMTFGFGAMPDYVGLVSPQDRWRIAAYIRALQLSQNATMDDVPAAQRNQIRKLSGAPQQGEHTPVPGGTGMQPTEVPR